LPQYEEVGKERGNTTLKWSKAEVVERAAAHIRDTDGNTAGNNGGEAKRVRAVRRHNKKLRDLIRAEFDLGELTDDQFRTLGLNEIRAKIAEKKKKEKKRESAHSMSNVNKIM